MEAKWRASSEAMCTLGGVWSFLSPPRFHTGIQVAAPFNWTWSQKIAMLQQRARSQKMARIAQAMITEDGNGHDHRRWRCSNRGHGHRRWHGAWSQKMAMLQQRAQSQKMARMAQGMITEDGDAQTGRGYL